MRGGKLVLAVAVTVGTSVACFSGDGQEEKLVPTWQTGANASRKMGVVQAAAINPVNRVQQVAQEVTDFGPLDVEDPFKTPVQEPQLPPNPVEGGQMFEPLGQDVPPAQPAAARPRTLQQPPAQRPRRLLQSRSGVPAPPEPAPRTALPQDPGLPVSTVSSPANFTPLQSQPVSSMFDLSAAKKGEAGPIVAVKIERDGDIALNQESTCTFLVKNNGGAVAGNVILEAYVPKNCEVTGSTPGTTEKGALTWTLGELQPGEERPVRLTMIARNPGAMKVQTFVRYSGQTEATFRIVEPKLKVALAGPKEAKVGEATPYVITVSNPGSGAAKNVTISARLPKGLEHRAGKHLTMQVGALAAGESRNVRLALTAAEPGNQPMSVDVIADGDLRDSADGAVNVLAPMLGLQIAGPQIRHAGRRGNYALVVTNPGNVAASNIRAKYRVPEGFEFVQADKGGRLTTDGTVEWFVGQLAPGETSQLKLVLKARTLGEFTHQAGVVSEQGASKSTEMNTRVEGVASVVVTIQDRDDPVELEQETLYEIRVANEGSKTGQNVILSCEIPNGLEVKSVRGPTNYFNRNGQVVFEPLKQLPVGKASVYQLLVVAKSGGSKKLRARVTSDSIRDPLITEELTRVYAD